MTDRPAFRSTGSFEGLRTPWVVILTASGAVAYAVVLKWVYVHLIVVPFGYLGLYLVDAPRWNTLSTMLVTVLSATLMPRRIERPSHLALWVIWIVCAAPTMLMGSYTGYLEPVTSALLSIAVCTALIVMRLITRSAPSGRSPFPRMPSRVLWTAIIVLSAVTYGLMAATLGLHLSYVSFDEVYDVRSEYRAELRGAGGVLPYLISPQAYVVNPLIMARGVMTRRPSLILLGALGQLVIYSSSGLKIVLFSTPLILLLAWAFADERRPRGLWFASSPVVVMLACAALDTQTSDTTWTSLLTRRFLATPGVLSAAYVDFFQSNPQAHLGHSILSNWVDYPYDQSPPLLVGQLVIPGSSLAANASVFADGFANFGWIGLVGAAALLGVFLRILDWCAAGLPLRVVAMAFIVPSIVLSNSGLLTSFLTHGLLACAGLLAIAPREGWQPREKSASRTVLDSSRRRLTARAAP